MQNAVIRTIHDLRSSGGLKSTDIANITAVSKATVSRWANGATAPHPRTQMILADLHFVIMRLEEFYSASEIRMWLFSPHPQLNGKKAIDLVHSGNAVEVLSILDRMDEGAFL